MKTKRTPAFAKAPAGRQNLIAAYCMVHELVRVVGKEKAMRIFFGPMPAPEV